MRIFRTFFFLAITLSWSVTGCFANPKLKPTPIPLQTLTQTLPPLPSVTPTVAPVIDTIKGSLRNQINNLEDNMPRANSEGYVAPTNQEQAAFADLVSALEVEDLLTAVHFANENYFTLSYYVDRGDDHAVSFLLREKMPIQKGWGLYAFRVDSTNNVIVEAPHPLYDDRTPSIALNIYRALNAHALLIAGAHRNANRDGSADVAHEDNSIFHSVQTALFTEISKRPDNPVILQIHGFAEGKHPNYPQVVLGSGETIIGSEILYIKKLSEALTARGVSVGVCNGKSWQDLCGTENVQASVVTNGVFIHIELNEKMRKNDNALITALIQVQGN